jgi:hypothetical protein
MVPPMSIIPDIFGDALSIAIVSFAVNISMAKLFSKKYKYELSPNQVFFEFFFNKIVNEKLIFRKFKRKLLHMVFLIENFYRCLYKTYTF